VNLPAAYPYNEKEQFLQWQEGNQAAFSGIFHQYYPFLMVFARRFVPFETAQDLLSETFIKLWQQKGSFASEAQLYQWLKITVRNGALNLLRQQKNTDARQQQLLSQLEDRYEEAFFQSEIETSLFTRIFAEINSLPPQQQKILRLFFLEGKDNAAIARELSISVQAVKNQKVTALKALRTTFSKEDLLLYLLYIGLSLPKIF
jgi:RNA polymerase sigma-70 factor (ECF subfamily)